MCKQAGAPARTVRILGAPCGTFQTAILEGSEEAALLQAIAARAQLSAGSFYLTTGTREDAVVPISTAIDNGITELHLHQHAARATLNPLFIALRRLIAKLETHLTCEEIRREA